MLKKTLLKLAVVIALISTFVAGHEYIWPFFDAEGTVEIGEYRGINIGDTKSDVILKVTTSVYGSKLRIEAYRGPTGRTIPVFTRSESYHLHDSDTWALAYPGIHKETILLFFKEGLVHKIKYQRDMLSP